MCSSNMKKKYLCIEYFLFDICLSVFIKIGFILMNIWTCLRKRICNACISLWFNHKGCKDECKFLSFCPCLYSVLFIYDEHIYYICFLIFDFYYWGRLVP